MSTTNRTYLLLIVGGIIIIGAATLHLLSPAMTAVASVGLITAVAALAMIWRSGTPAQPMRQLLYDMDPHESPARAGRR